MSTQSKSKTAVATTVATKHTASTLLLAVAKNELTATDAAKLLPAVCTSAYKYTSAKVLLRHAKWVGQSNKYATLADKLLSAAESISSEYAKVEKSA